MLKLYKPDYVFAMKRNGASEVVVRLAEWRQGSSLSNHFAASVALQVILLPRRTPLVGLVGHPSDFYLLSTCTWK